MECSPGLVTLIPMRLLLILGLLAAPLGAATLRWASGENRTHLLELYSSEGCSSCPPAEAWLGGLRDEAGLWRDYVPVAFHVVYWDHLGWKDRFASKTYTARQYAYASRWGSSTVYTPGFVLDGKEWRKSARPPAPTGEVAGVLALEYDEDGMCRVKFDVPGDYEVTVVRLGGGISSAVRAGENGGRTLQHEFVALALQTVPLVDGSAEVKLAKVTDQSVGRQAVAAWVTRRGELTPRQATGGWLK